MARGNPNGMTAKRSLKFLRGEQIRLKNERKLAVQAARREALLTGQGAEEASLAGEDAAVVYNEQLMRLEYAEAAVYTFMKSGKSALKAAAAVGYTPGTGKPKVAVPTPLAG